VTNLFHLIMPFLINCVSIIILLITMVRHKLTLTNIHTVYNLLGILKQEIVLYRVSLMSPFILILLGLPRLISSFAFSCGQQQWHQQLLFVSYLISLLPMVLTPFIFILPKASYKAELVQSLTNIWRFIRNYI
jgi:hypothetical protein